MADQVVIGYGPDGTECQPATPKCIAQARLRDKDTTFYVRSFGAELVDPGIYPRYSNEPFVRVSEPCFRAFHRYLVSRQPHEYLAADRLFREWS